MLGTYKAIPIFATNYCWKMFLRANVAPSTTKSRGKWGRKDPAAGMLNGTQPSRPAVSRTIPKCK